MRNLFTILLIGYASIIAGQTLNIKGNVNLKSNSTYKIDNVNYSYYNGFYDYNDSITAVTPIAYTTGSPLQLTNDARGEQTIDTYKPYGLGQVWDTINNQIDLSDLSLGDEVMIRVSCDVTTSSNNQEFRIYMLMSVGFYDYQLQDGIWYFKTAGLHKVESVIPFYIGNAGTKDYPAQIMFTSDANATITVNGFYISIKRRI